jgi:signal peptidase I
MFLEVSTGLLSQGYGVRFRPGGLSMHPTIRDGEPVTVEPIEASRVKRGDIILYKTERGLVAHRVVRIERGGDGDRVFYLRGDASTSGDAPVMAEQILGRVVVVERRGRKIALRGYRARLSRAAHTYVVPFKVLVKSVVQRKSLP